MEGLIMDTQLQKLAKVWPGIQHYFSIPHSKKEYNKLAGLLDSLIDEVGEDESHPLASLMAIFRITFMPATLFLA